MIEFNGELSEKGKNYIANSSRKISVLVGFFVVTPFALVDVVYAIVKHFYILLIFLIPLAMVIAFSFIKPNKKSLSLIMPNRIIIQDEIIISEGENFHTEKEIEEIKKIVDLGDFYRIYFFFPNYDFAFICQKNLITKGSIELFELKFKDLIERIN